MKKINRDKVKRFGRYLLRLLSSYVQLFSYGSLIAFSVHVISIYSKHADACSNNEVYCLLTSAPSTTWFFSSQVASYYTQSKAICRQFEVEDDPSTCQDFPSINKTCMAACPIGTVSIQNCCPGTCAASNDSLSSNTFDAWCKCEIDKAKVVVGGMPLCGVNYGIPLGLTIFVLMATNLIYMILLCTVMCGCTKTCGLGWRHRIMIRTPCISAIMLLVKPHTIFQWEKSLQESYKLDIVFTVFQDIPQFSASIFMFFHGQKRVVTYLALIGSGASILLSLARYFFKVYKSFDNNTIEEKKAEENSPLIRPNPGPVAGPVVHSGPYLPPGQPLYQGPPPMIQGPPPGPPVTYAMQQTAPAPQIGPSGPSHPQNPSAYPPNSAQPQHPPQVAGPPPQGYYPPPNPNINPYGPPQAPYYPPQPAPYIQRGELSKLADQFESMFSSKPQYHVVHHQAPPISYGPPGPYMFPQPYPVKQAAPPFQQAPHPNSQVVGPPKYTGQPANQPASQMAPLANEPAKTEEVKQESSHESEGHQREKEAQQPVEQVDSPQVKKDPTNDEEARD